MLPETDVHIWMLMLLSVLSPVLSLLTVLFTLTPPLYSSTAAIFSTQVCGSHAFHEGILAGRLCYCGLQSVSAGGTHMN